MEPYLIDWYLNLPIYTNEEKYRSILDSGGKLEKEKENIDNSFLAANSIKALIEKIDKFIAEQPWVKAVFCI